MTEVKEVKCSKGFWSKLWKAIKEIFKPTPPTPPTPPEKTSDEFITELTADATKETDKTPDITDVKFNFSNGEYVQFQTRNVQEIWSVNGTVKKTDGTVVGLNANVALRHRVLAVMGDANARNLGANNLRLGAPPLPVVAVEKIYYWETLNNKRVYELNDVGVYVMRVVELLKGELGITSKMTSVEGEIVKYRS